VVEDGVTGYIEDNIDDLIKKVKDLDKIDRYACRKRVEDNFSDKKMVNGYIQTYYDMIKPSKISIMPIKKESNLSNTLNIKKQRERK